MDELTAVCARCNNIREVSNLAVIDGVPLCHGEWDRSPTCYERTGWEGPTEHPAHLAERFRATYFGDPA